MSYRDQLNRFKSQCDKAGIQELTLTQKARDREVRLALSEEMGHFREQITAVYLGR